MDGLIQQFVEDSEEVLSTVSRILIEYPPGAISSTHIDEIFRAYHSIKGAAAAIDLSTEIPLSDVGRAAHTIEDFLQSIRDRARMSEPEHRALSTVNDLLLESILDLDPDAPPGPALVQHIKVALEQDLDADGPEAGAIDEVDLDALFQQEAAEQNQRTKTYLEKQKNAAPVEEKRIHTKRSTSIRVPIQKIEDLIDNASELGVTISAVLEAIHSVRPDLLVNFRELFNRLEQMGRDLQEGVMRVRMMPFETIVERLEFAVRDTARATHKKVRLETKGEHVELDKQVLETMIDPLTHMIRNAIDHGIEAPAERLRKGKPEEGKLRIESEQLSGQVIITLSDDGAGIDVDKLVKKAEEKGLDVCRRSMNENRLFDLMCYNGVSSSSSVSQVSGRGVGMGVVRANIQALGGSVAMSTELGVGTVFRITIPLTLTIVDAQLVQVGEAIAAIPVIAISEIIVFDQNAVMSVNGNTAVIHHRGEYVRVVDLRQIWHLPERKKGKEKCVDYMVIVTHQQRRYGVRVDRLLAQKRIIYKQILNNTLNAPTVSGTTILSDGALAMILDIGDLIERDGAMRDDGCGPEVRHG